MLAKVHHCMIDGVSGVQLLGVMFDVTPSPPPPPAAPPAEAPPPLPTPSDAGAAGAGRRRRRRRRGRARAGRAAPPSRRRRWSEIRETAGAFGELMRLLLAPLPRTPFNGFVGTLRRIEWATLRAERR